MKMVMREEKVRGKVYGIRRVRDRKDIGEKKQ